MESMRDIDRAMEREIAKGSCPLRFIRIEFGDSPYQEIASREKLLEVLSYLLRTGDYGRFAGKGTGNNVYMDIKGRKPAFQRTRSFLDRNSIFSAIRRYGKKIKPDFDGHTYLETVRCIFELPEGEQEKYRVTYDGRKPSLSLCQINISSDFTRTVSRQGGRHRRIWIFPEQAFRRRNRASPVWKMCVTYCSNAFYLTQ